MLAQLYDFKFPKPLEAYLEKPKPPEKRTLKNDGPLACHLCPRKFRVEYSLRQHCISQHSSHYLCSHCNVCFAIEDVQGFKFHMFRHELIGKIFSTLVFSNVLVSNVRWRFFIIKNSVSQEMATKSRETTKLEATKSRLECISKQASSKFSGNFFLDQL